jgi:hypothetical protein
VLRAIDQKVYRRSQFIKNGLEEEPDRQFDRAQFDQSGRLTIYSCKHHLPQMRKSLLTPLMGYSSLCYLIY